MQADVAEYEYYRSRHDCTSLLFAFWSMSTKLALALSVLIAFPLLEILNFTPDLSDNKNNLLALAVIYAAVPIVCKIITILIIFIITYYISKYLSNKKKITITSKPKIIVPSDITALRQLNKLEKEKIWQAGNVKEYHSQLSEIIRRYTENRFEFIALEMTTYEIIEELKSTVNINDEELKDFRILLQRADLAKFAKSKPVDSENIESMSIAKRFVSSTKKAKGNE